jgi:hypothetical protein
VDVSEASRHMVFVGYDQTAASRTCQVRVCLHCNAKLLFVTGELAEPMLGCC